MVCGISVFMWPFGAIFIDCLGSFMDDNGKVDAWFVRVPLAALHKIR